VDVVGNVVGWLENKIKIVLYIKKQT
jgi:hypothetical protein